MTASCPVCRHDQAGKSLRKGGWNYAICAKCGHGWLNPLPSAAELAEVYTSAYFQESDNGGYSDYVGDEPLHRLNAADRLRRLQALVQPPGKLLDIGCAAGFFLDEARTQGWEVTGQDCSPWAKEYVAKRFGFPWVSDLESFAAEHAGDFSAVTLFQVLEHMPDPAAVLRQIHALLAPRGALLIETWNRESLIARLSGSFWQQVTPPSVLQLFSNRSLQQLLEDCGFQKVAIRGSGKRVSAGFVGNLLVHKYPFLKPLQACYPEWLGVHRLSAIYALGDLVTASAQCAGEEQC